MESRDRKKNDYSWFWAALDRPLTDAQRNALRTLFAPAGKAGGTKPGAGRYDNAGPAGGGKYGGDHAAAGDPDCQNAGAQQNG